MPSESGTMTPAARIRPRAGARSARGTWVTRRGDRSSRTVSLYVDTVVPPPEDARSAADGDRRVFGPSPPRPVGDAVEAGPWGVPPPGGGPSAGGAEGRVAGPPPPRPARDAVEAVPWWLTQGSCVQ